jgi:hypothetical protein
LKTSPSYFTGSCLKKSLSSSIDARVLGRACALERALAVEDPLPVEADADAPRHAWTPPPSGEAV